VPDLIEALAAANPAAAQAIPFILEIIGSQGSALRRTRLWQLLTRLCSIPLYGETKSPMEAFTGHVPTLLVALEAATGRGREGRSRGWGDRVSRFRSGSIAASQGQVARMSCAPASVRCR
jgi:hypothetical protein